MVGKRPLWSGHSPPCASGEWRGAEQRPQEKQLGKGGYMGRKAKAAAATSPAKNIPRECQDLDGLCVCVCYLEHVFTECEPTSVCPCTSCTTALLPSPIGTGNSVVPVFLGSISRCFKRHCPLLSPFDTHAKYVILINSRSSVHFLLPCSGSVADFSTGRMFFSLFQFLPWQMRCPCRILQSPPLLSTREPLDKHHGRPPSPHSTVPPPLSHHRFPIYTDVF